MRITAARRQLYLALEFGPRIKLKSGSRLCRDFPDADWKLHGHQSKTFFRRIFHDHTELLKTASAGD